MTKINPPLPKGHRRQETTTLAVYSATRDTLKTLAERKNTSMMEYARWLVDCAEAGLVLSISAQVNEWLDLEAARRKVTKSELIVFYCEMGMSVAAAGADTLDEYCTIQRNKTLAAWVKSDDAD